MWKVKVILGSNPNLRTSQDVLAIQQGVMVGSDPGSIDGQPFATDKPPSAKGKAQWSEHVWSK